MFWGPGSRDLQPCELRSKPAPSRRRGFSASKMCARRNKANFKQDGNQDWICVNLNLYMIRTKLLDLTGNWLWVPKIRLNSSLGPFWGHFADFPSVQNNWISEDTHNQFPGTSNYFVLIIYRSRFTQIQSWVCMLITIAPLVKYGRGFSSTRARVLTAARQNHNLALHYRFWYEFLYNWTG